MPRSRLTNRRHFNSCRHREEPPRGDVAISRSQNGIASPPAGARNDIIVKGVRGTYEATSKRKPKGYYPVALDLDGKRCLVIGGGKVAERKVERLLDYGAKVELVSPSLTPALERWAREGRIQYRRGRFSGRYLKKQTLLFAVTDDVSLNQRIARAAEKKGILANCAKPGNASSFIVPALLKRGSFTVAVSTDGRSPKKAQALRRKLEGVL